MSDLKSKPLVMAVLRALYLFGVATAVGLVMGTPLARAAALAAPIGVVLGVVSFFRAKKAAAARPTIGGQS